MTDALTNVTVQSRRYETLIGSRQIMYDQLEAVLNELDADTQKRILYEVVGLLHISEELGVINGKRRLTNFIRQQLADTDAV